MDGGAIKKAASAARFKAVSVSASRQASAWRTMSTSSLRLEGRAALLRLGPRSAIALTTERSPLVGIDDLANELAAHDVSPGEGNVVDLVDAPQQGDRLKKARVFAGRKVDLGRIASDNHLALLAKPRNEHLE